MMPPSRQPVRLALMGVGAWGEKLLAAFGGVEGAAVVRLCDPDVDKARCAARARFPPMDRGGVEVVAEPARVFADPAVDAVIIASPPALHHRQAREALQAGKHVFVEKPLALERGHAEELVALSEQHGSVLMVGHVLLFDPAVRWIAARVTSGAAGEVRSAEFVRLGLGRIRRDVGALWNLAPHDIAMADFWFGERAVEVRASGACVLQQGIEDMAFLELGYPSGRRARIHVSWLDSSRSRRAVLVGSREILVLSDAEQQLRVGVLDVASPGARDPQRVARLLMGETPDGMWFPRLSSREPLVAEAEHFVDCVRRGAQPLADGHGGISVVSVLEAAHQAMNQPAAQPLAIPA